LITERLYTTSTAELTRRLRAYTTLIVSLLAGIAVSSVDYLIAAPGTWLSGLAGLALALAHSRFVVKRTFRRYLELELRLDDTHVTRVRGGTSETFALADMVGLRVLRTSRGSLREITVKLTGGRRLSVNGVEDFERFEQDLHSRLPANVAVTEAREPIDYDHPFFYVVFGLITGVAFTLAVRALATLSESGMKWATLAIACYSAILGVYVLLARPLSQRYGPRSRLGDFLLGLAALGAGVLLAARSFL
jgi:hypothetical protein